MENRLVVLNRLIAQLERDVDFMDKYIKIVQEGARDVPPYQPQSASEVIAENQETVTFADAEGGDKQGFAATSTAFVEDDHVNQATLRDFLARPVLINTITWLETANTGTTLSGFNPWNLFFNDPRIKNKLHNFAFLRANLKIKVLVNASPFYFGRAAATYIPVPNFTPDKVYKDTDNLWLIPYSQRPKVWIRPEDNAAGELTLPFFYYKNWLTIKSASEFANMGKVEVVTYTPLASANAATGTGVTIQIYAWAEDVQLSGSTLSLAMQSGDEYMTGPVSGPASALAKVASSLEPVFGRFATASRMALDTTAGIAKLFGYTNVPVISETQPRRIAQFAQFASPEIGHPVEKLTLDSKNELSVDPTVLGLPNMDELAISNFVGRESYLFQTAWDTTQTYGTTLAYMRVTPSLYARNLALTPRPLYYTPMAYVASAFERWRGDITITFDFVASRYHKGRVQITYDPLGDSTNNVVNTNNPSSGAYVVIVDLAERTSVSMTIPYQQALPWLKTENAVDGSQNFDNSTTPTFAPSQTNYNGYICMKVLTSLSAPVTTSTIPVLISVKGEKNLEFANPVTMRGQVSPFIQQSTDEVVGGDVAPVELKRGLVNYGEVVRSLRSIMRRTNYAYPVAWNNAATTGVVDFNFKHFKMPPYPGYDPAGLDVVTKVVGIGTANYNWTIMTPLQWFTLPFVGYKGSVIWHYHPKFGNLPADSMLITRFPDNTTDASKTTSSSGSGVTVTGLARAMLPASTAGGASLTAPRQSAGTGVVVPNCTSTLFQSTSPYNATQAALGFNSDLSGQDSVEVTISAMANTVPTNNAASAPIMDTYAGAGTDFTCLFYLCTPTLWYTATIPTPA